MIRFATLRGAALAATLLAPLAACQESASREAKDGSCRFTNHLPKLTNVVSSFAFDAKALTDLGVSVKAVSTAPAAPQHSLSILLGEPTSYASTNECLAVDVAEGHVTAFHGGRIAHRGGPTLTYGANSIDLSGFEVRVGAKPRTFEIYNAVGDHVFDGTLPHYQLDRATGVLDVFNVDLEITPLVAERWKLPHLAGYMVGTLTMRGQLSMPSGMSVANLSTPQNACDDWSGNVDVALIEMDAVQQRARLGDKVVITPSATLKNVGTANVPWQAKFSGVFPPYNTDQHPFLVWALYRETSGVFEQLAHSDVKHAFLTINSNCAPGSCTQGSVLGLGCEDVYGVSTNGAHLAPRSEILPAAGTWAHCNFPAANTPSHFDQAAPWCQQDNNGSTEGVLEHRVVASDAELSVAGANYYFASWYVVRDDINIFNNMGWRRIVPSLSGGTWTFALATPFRQGSVVDAFVDPATPSPTRLNTRFTDPDAGSVQIAVTATDLGNGKYRYVYAVHNHDFDPQISSILIPTVEGVNLEQPKFTDGDDDASNNWIISNGIGQITFAAPTTSARLAWGRMFTFSFTANAPPARASVRIVRSDVGGSISIKSLSPGAP